MSRSERRYDRPATTSTTTDRAAAPVPAPRTARPTTTPSPGVVVTVDRGRFTLLTSTATTVMAMKSRPLGRKGVVVGDHVRVVGDICGDDGSLARIVEVVERTTTLRRTADDDDPVERVIVSNADQLVVVDRPGRSRAAPAADRPRAGGGVRRGDGAAALPDQGRPRRPRDAAVDLPLRSACRGSSPSSRGRRERRRPAELRDRLRGRTSVLVGHSGVGKSTLVNALIPERAPRGRHRQRRHRTRSAHVHLRLSPRAARRRRLDHRHPGHPVLRAGARASRRT